MRALVLISVIGIAYRLYKSYWVYPVGKSESPKTKTDLKRNDNPELVWAWFHWSRRPRVYINYWCPPTGEQRYKDIFNRRVK